MITTEQYIEAVRIVKEYHSQLDAEINSHNRVLIEDWIKGKELSTRLLNVLKWIHTENRDTYERTYLQYMDEITEEKFLSMRNAGKRSWYEFKALTSKSGT